MSDDSFSPGQLAQLRQVFRDELADAGLRVDGGDHQDEARRDFMFLRSLRRATNGAAAKVGWAIIAAFIGGLVWLVAAGLNFWRGSGP